MRGMQALLVVDIQNDFMPFGALPVASGDEVVPVANDLMTRFELVVASQDWHPADHGSFAVNNPPHVPGDFIELGGVPQVLWPPHCVQNTPGASFHSGLDVAWFSHVTRKGTDPGIDSYSTFFDNHHLKATDLDAYLRAHDVRALVMCGLATDYCVKYSALDARALGYEVSVVEDGCRAVELAPGDGERALDEMRAAGCHIIRSPQLWL
jgi:nicotinamidase/pyrazinamidase